MKGTIDFLDFYHKYNETITRVLNAQNGGGWSEFEGKPNDPWTTGQILSTLKNLNISYSKNVIEEGVKWLENNRNLDKGWGLEKQSDTQGVCWAILGLINSGISKDSNIIEDAKEWLKDAKNPDDGGWPNHPGEKESTTYCTALVAKTIYLIKEGTKDADLIRSARNWLYNNQHIHTDWGWGHSEKGTEDIYSESDSTHFCYALHGLLDIDEDMFSERIQNAAKELAKRQSLSGSWEDWQGNKESIEGTAYAIYILLRTGFPFYNKHIINGLEWLLSHYLERGGWPKIPNEKQFCIWTTHNVLYSLHLFIEKSKKSVYELEKLADIKKGYDLFCIIFHDVKSKGISFDSFIDTLLDDEIFSALEKGVDADEFKDFKKIERSTASHYLNSLTDIGFLEKGKKVGRAKGIVERRKIFKIKQEMLPLINLIRGLKT